jgi:hypothetical protein
MSNDWSDGPGSNDDLDSSQSPWDSPNTTDPGEPGAGWQNEPSGGFAPMGPVTISDVFDNFQTVLNRSLSSGVVWAFVALLAVQFSVMCVGAVGTFAATIGLSGVSEMGQLGSNSELIGGTMAIAFLGVVAVSMIPQLFITGLFNPMKSALFGGQQPHQGFKWSLSKAAENVLDIFLVGALYILALTPAIGLGVLINPFAALLWFPVVMIAAFFLMPVLWYVATGHGVFGSISKAFSTVMNNLLLFVLFIAIIFAGSLAMGCVSTVLGFIPILGSLASMLLSFVVQYIGWVFYVALVATIESHELGREIY